MSSNFFNDWISEQFTQGPRTTSAESRIPERGEPTNASPGSEEKIRVLMARAARREPLFHPNDGLRVAAVKMGRAPTTRDSLPPLARELPVPAFVPAIREETITAL
jgi:hypothetical protein